MQRNANLDLQTIEIIDEFISLPIMVGNSRVETLRSKRKEGKSKPGKS
jgi:hypothetical protein